MKIIENNPHFLLVVADSEKINYTKHVNPACYVRCVPPRRSVVALPRQDQSDLDVFSSYLPRVLPGRWIKYCYLLWSHGR